MLLLIGFAFLAGVVTVLSPCILPVLPIILSGGIGSGKARPWGVITGFLLSFTTFTLTLSALVQSIGLDPDLLRWLAAALVLGFGVVLVVPVLKDAFLRWTSSLLTRTAAPVTPGKSAGGFWSGLLLGVGLGVVWTPCVGPIMASVISLALSQSVDASSVFITLAYTTGTAIPLFLIMMGGRTLLNRAPWFTRHSSGIQRGFGVVMILTAVALFTGGDRAFSTWLLTTFPSYGAGLTALENHESVQAELDKRRSVLAPNPGDPEVDPLTLGQGDAGNPWLISAPMTRASLLGKVVLIDFWTYSCVNCVRTLPYLRSWYQRYHAAGLEIIGVHSPEFAFERSSENVLRAMKDLGVTWPVVQDNAFGIWNAYQNQYWPAHYLYGRDGKELQRHFGEGNYAETEAAIAAALGVPVVSQEVEGAVPVSTGPRTPETYLGYGRGSRFASPEDVVTENSAVYSYPTDLERDQWALSGAWTIGKDSSVSASGSRLKLNYQGSRVYLVLHPASGRSATLRVTVNGQPVTGGDVRNGLLTVDVDRLYQLVDQPAASGGLLEITTETPVSVYAFTFG